MPTDLPDLVDSKIPDFNRTQLHVLQILWDAEGPMKPSDIEERFDWPIENATLRSVLRVLVERGEIEREKLGKAFVYRPRNEKRRTLSNVFSGLARVFSGGSRAGLLAQLLQDDSLTRDEIRELEAIATETSAKTSTKSDDD
ncbi:MAG: BlaI family penicillinase repressor [Verrucomicrobiales bacterium]|jgi:BlaI family penicillinase repressor